MNKAPAIESHDFTIGDLFNDFYSVPDFQREYVWEQKEVEKLLDDLFDEFCDAGGRVVPGPEYFLGSIVVCPGDDGTKQLIDGQQRLTTIYLLFCAIRDCLRERGTQRHEALEKIIASVSMHPETGQDVFRYRLSLQYDDSKGILEKIATSGRPPEEVRITTSMRNISEAYDAIRVFLTTRLRDDPVLIRPFLGALNSRVKLIRILTPSLTNALKVFETINDRGVGLNAMDLLKNLVFMNTSAADYPRLKDRWKRLVDTLDKCREKPMRFLRYYIMSHYDIDWRAGLREDEIYAWFADHATLCQIDSQPIAFVERLVLRAKSYAYFTEGKDSDGNPNRYLANIAALSGAVRQHYILLLAANSLPKEPFLELCRNIENLFFCYIMTREPTRDFERNFARWAADLRMTSDMDGLRAFIEKYVVPELAQHATRFDLALREMSQDRIQQYRMRYILAKLCQYVEEHAWDWKGDARQTLANYLDSSIHIEHVLPQSPASGVREAFDKPDEYPTYVGKFGNLTLLEKGINSVVSNGFYQHKVPGYKQSKLLLTQSLVEKPVVGKHTQFNRAVAGLPQFEEWTSDAIELRQLVLADLAHDVWGIPRTISTGKDLAI